MTARLIHIVPYSKGGKTTPDNGQLAHRGCNASKNAVFRSRRGTSIRILTYDLCSVFSNVKLVVRSASLRMPARKILHING